MTIEEIQEQFKDLSDGIRVILLIHRTKEGGKNNKYKRHLKKVITTNSQEYFDTIRELKEIKDSDKRTLRIYATVNDCDINKAIRLFKQRQLDNDYASEKLNLQFYLDIKNQFISCLMDKSCRNSKNFLFDLDGCDDRSFKQIHQRISKLTEIILSYPTKNGYHIITKPFNYKSLDENLINTVKGHYLMLVDF